MVELMERKSVVMMAVKSADPWGLVLVDLTVALMVE